MSKGDFGYGATVGASYQRPSGIGMAAICDIIYFCVIVLFYFTFQVIEITRAASA